MRRWFLLVLAGCYAPTAPAGAPCTADRSCPAGLVCQPVGGMDVCIVPGTLGPDAGHDAAEVPDAPDADDGMGDLDGDGVTDAMDLCPQVPDDQHDEDGDAIGDACDRCPIGDNDGNDSDGDGLPDACDVVASPGADRLALFHGFGSQPMGWSVGSLWSFDEDRAGYANLTLALQRVTAPDALTGSIIVWSQVTVAQLGMAGGVGIGLGDAGVACGISLEAGIAYLVVFDLAQFTELTRTSVGSFVPGSTWGLLFARSAPGTLQCVAIDTMQMYLTEPVSVVQPAAVQPFLVAFNAEATFEFLMVTQRQ